MVSEGLMTAGFLPENGGYGQEKACGRDHHRNGKEAQVVRDSPQPQHDGADTGGDDPGLALGIKLRADEKEDGRESVDPAAERCFDGAFGNSTGKDGAQKMQ